MFAQTGLKLSFSSDFSQFGLAPTGTQIWRTVLPHGLRTLTGNGELEYYADPSGSMNPFSLNGPELDITASRTSNTLGLPFTSGVITTQNSFTQLYGYFEITAELPAGKGMWPAFWLLPANGAGTQELDVMEEFGHAPDQFTTTVHSPSSGIAGTVVKTVDLTKGFHTYGLYWTPTTISTYLDGQLVAVARTPADMNTPMYMIANLAVSHDAPLQAGPPAVLRIAGIEAFAYNPAVAGPVDPLKVVVPNAAVVVCNTRTLVHGIAISDGAARASDVVTVSVSDKALGLLSVTGTAGVTVSGDKSWSLQLSGTLAGVNASLATLSYKNGNVTPSDTITVAGRDPYGDIDSARVQITLSPPPATSFILIGPHSTQATANGTDEFVMTAGQIADPRQGAADQILNFHIATPSSLHSDFIAFRGFAAGAALVFDHLGQAGDQYYRVDSSAGGSPVFVVQMVNHAAAHLGAADSSFYPA